MVNACSLGAAELVGAALNTLTALEKVAVAAVVVEMVLVVLVALEAPIRQSWGFTAPILLQMLAPRPPSPLLPE